MRLLIFCPNGIHLQPIYGPYIDDVDGCTARCGVCGRDRLTTHGTIDDCIRRGIIVVLTKENNTGALKGCMKCSSDKVVDKARPNMV